MKFIAPLLLLLVSTLSAQVEQEKEARAYLDSIGQNIPELVLQQISEDSLIENMMHIFKTDQNISSAIESVHFYVLSNILKEASEEIIDLLNKEERELFEQVEIKIDSIPSLYFADMPVKVNRQSKTLTFKSKWFHGLKNSLDAANIETIPSFDRDWFSPIYQYFRLTEDMPILAIEHAGLSESQLSMIESFSYQLPIITAWQYNIEFILMHEFSHLMYPEYNEIQADSFAISKLMSFCEYNEKELQEAKSDLSKMNLPIAFQKSFDNVNIIKAYTLLLYTKTLDFIISETLLNPIDYIEVMPELSRRIDVFYTKAAEFAGCYDDNNAWEYCDELLKKQSANKNIYNTAIGMTNLYLKLDSTFQYLNVDNNDDKEEIKRVSKSLEPNNPAAVLFFYGTYLLGKNYFDANSSDIKRAMVYFQIGGDFSQTEEIQQASELCYLILAKLYERNLKQRGEAVKYYTNAMNISTFFSKDFYINSIRKTKEIDYEIGY